MIKIIIAVIALLFISTSCNHKQNKVKHPTFEQKPPDIGLGVDNDIPVKIPEPTFIFSYSLILILFVNKNRV